MEAEVYRRLETQQSDLRLFGHRLGALEKEDLPRRLAQVEPVVRRVDEKVDAIASKLDAGMAEVKAAILVQKTMQRSIVWTVGIVVGAIQLLFMLKDFFLG